MAHKNKNKAEGGTMKAKYQMEKGITTKDEAIGIAYIMAAGEGTDYAVVEWLKHTLNTGYGVRNLYGRRYTVAAATDAAEFVGVKNGVDRIVFTAKPEELGQ